MPAGGCLCGAVRYEVVGEPKHVSHCHCTRCRKASGAPMATWAFYREEQVQVTKGAAKVFQSLPGAERMFCAACGSQLFFRSSEAPGMLDVSAGSLDDPAKAAPSHHNFIGTRMPWLHLAKDLPAFPGATPEDPN